MTIKRRSPYIDSVSHSFGFCWWRHNQLLMTSQWTDNRDGITWIMISNSLNIDFIHGDIHVRSCKISPKICILLAMSLCIIVVVVVKWRSILSTSCTVPWLGKGVRCHQVLNILYELITQIWYELLVIFAKIIEMNPSIYFMVYLWPHLHQL